VSTSQVTLGDLVRETDSGFASGERSADGVLQVRMNCVDTDGHLDLSVAPRVPPISQISRYLLEPDDVLFNATNSPDLVGKSALFRGSLEPVTFSNHFLRLRVRTDRLEPAYLVRWLGYQWKRRLFHGMCTQWVNQASIRSERLLQLTLPLPPLAEQRRIAAMLDKADAVRRKRRDSLRLLDEFLRSAFLEMFGHPVRNPKRWETKLLGDLALIRRGASPRPIEQYLGGTTPWIKISDATDSTDLYIRAAAENVTDEGASKSVRLSPGSVLVANSGVSLGFARILAIGGCIHDGWLSVENLDQRVNKLYFVSLINVMTPRLRAMAPTGTQPNLNTGILRMLSVSIPPIALQERFAVVLQAAAQARRGFGNASDAADSLFDSLAQRAFGSG